MTDEMTAFPPKMTTSQVEEKLVRDEIKNELYMPYSSTIVLKRKKEMLYVLLDFENGLTIDAVVDSGAYVSAKAQKELERIKQQAPVDIFETDDPPIFEIQVANGQFEKPIAKGTPSFDFGGHNFAERSDALNNLTGPNIALHFHGHNSVVVDTTHRLILFPHLTRQIENGASETSAKPQIILLHDSIIVPPVTTKSITGIVDHSWEWNTTGTVTSVEKITEAANLIISHSISSVFDKKIAVRVTNTTELSYSVTKNTQIAEFSVVTPEQSKFIRPVDTAIVSMIPEGDPHLTTYLIELLRENKPEQQNNTF